MRILILFFALTFLSLPVASKERFEACGGFPPPTWDYTDPRNRQPSGDAGKGRVYLVESAHFTPPVENLIRGSRGSSAVGDIHYTLRRFPNHPRALWALSRASRHEKWKGQATDELVTCAFERAIFFKKDYATIWMLYGMHLHLDGKLESAKEKFVEAGRLGLESVSSEYHYNYGLLLVDLGDLDGAIQQAEKAFRLGYRLPGLRNKIDRAKKKSQVPGSK